MFILCFLAAGAREIVMAERDEARVPFSYIDSAAEAGSGVPQGCKSLCMFWSCESWWEIYTESALSHVITIEPIKEHKKKGEHKTAEDTISLISDAPTVEHFNISVSEDVLLKLVYNISSVSFP